MPLIETGARPDMDEEEFAEKVCRICGCSEADGCPGGCWWVTEDGGMVETDPCTACLVGGEGGR